MDTLFFIASKITQFCIEPLNLILLSVLLAFLFLALRKYALCKHFLQLTLMGFFIIGYLPLSEFPLRVLENAISQTDLKTLQSEKVAGLIILGGAIDGDTTSDRQQVTLGSAAERVTKAFELMRLYPNLPYIFAGNSGDLSPQGMPEAQAFKQLIQEQGLGAHRGYFEGRSRNTYENAVMLKPLLIEAGVESGRASEPWILLTSASHMLRSVLIFKKQGIAVLPLLVDYQTRSYLDWTGFDLTIGAQQWANFLHETVGLVGYWLTGKI
ncbi:COG1434 Uncharacterized conserved protein [Burkholderiaceae bacterium]|jgi:uncharacterized SAM-binding protein YcdF (DUF218 family)